MPSPTCSYRQFKSQDIEYTRPTLGISYYSFIYYAGFYMFRHLCAIFRERPLSLWVTWKSEMVVSSGCTVNVGGLCAPDVVGLCVSGQLATVTHETTTSGAHRPPTFTVQGYIPMSQPFRTFKLLTRIKDAPWRWHISAKTRRSLSNK
jgi:hypothetical protein